MRRLSTLPLVLLAAGCLSLSGLRAETTLVANPPAVRPAPATTPEALEQRLVGKMFFLRGFYLDDHLEFDTAGHLKSNSPRGSFALSGLQVRKVRFTKHTMEIEADRIGLHFFGALPYEDDSKPYETLVVSKKPVEITIDRLVIEPEKKKKDKDKKKGKSNEPQPSNAAGKAQDLVVAQAPAAQASAAPGSAASGSAAQASAAPTSSVAGAAQGQTAPAVLQIHDPKESYIVLSSALDKILANGLDDSVIETLPGYWQEYFATKAGKVRTAALDSALRPGGDVIAPRLLTAINPESNDFAQRNGIAGMILLRTVVSSSGRPGPVTIVRPIGFGLDEKAVEAIERSQFRPGMKDGNPVPVVVNLEVTFRIYSNMTRPKHGAPLEVAPKSAPSPGDRRDGGTTVAAARVGE